MSVIDAINRANAILPGEPAPEDEEDPRWQAMLEISHHIESNPEEIWQFVRRWGTHEQDDLRMAVACCLLEDLLEHHFDLIFPRVESAVKEDVWFADTFSHCWKFGQSELPANEPRFDELQRTCSRIRDHHDD